MRMLKRLSDESGVHIIPNTGVSITKYAYEIFKVNFAEQMAARWISDFKDGMEVVDGVTNRPGYIKLLLDRGGISDVDRELLRAAVMASKETGLPIHCHVLESCYVHDVIALLEAEDADFSKFLWAHADEEGDFDVIETAVKKGMWFGFDMIKQGQHEEKAALLKQALDRGHERHIILSQDHDMYDEVDKLGAEARCASFFTEFLPLCIEQGVSEEVLERIVVENPGRFYDVV